MKNVFKLIIAVGIVGITATTTASTQPQYECGMPMFYGTSRGATENEARTLFRIQYPQFSSYQPFCSAIRPPSNRQTCQCWMRIMPRTATSFGTASMELAKGYLTDNPSDCRSRCLNLANGYASQKRPDSSLEYVWPTITGGANTRIPIPW